jgi:hypothetical protein
MSYFRTEKVISSLPATLEADTIYFVRTGAGYRQVVTDTTGSIAFEQNLPAATQAEVITGLIDDKAVTPATLFGSNVARTFFGSINLALGSNTLVHGLDLSDRDSAMVTTRVDNSAVYFDIDSVDENTITLTTALAVSNVKVTVIGF